MIYQVNKLFCDLCSCNCYHVYNVAVVVVVLQCIVVGIETFEYSKLLEHSGNHIGLFDVIFSIENVPLDKPTLLPTLSNGFRCMTLCCRRSGIQLTKEILSKGNIALYIVYNFIVSALITFTF